MEEAIKVYRDTFRLNLKIGFREDIEVTVKDLDLWKTILSEWKEKKWSPFSVKWMLSEYERREKQTKRAFSTLERPDQRNGNKEDHQAGVSERFNRGVSVVRQRTRVHVRRNSQTLEEIITNALRAQNRA